MKSVSITTITFLCCMVGYLVGQWISRRQTRGRMEQDHPREVLMAATGMIATLVALVLGLLVSSAKTTFDKTSDMISDGGAKVIELDRSLRRFGPEANPARAQLRQFVSKAIERIDIGAKRVELSDLPDGLVPPPTIEDVMAKPLHLLQAQTEEQKQYLAQAASIIGSLSDTRWQLIERASNPLPTQFLVLLYFWLTVLFIGFGLLAPIDSTFFVAFAICGLSMAGAVYLILEMNNPLDGSLRVSSAPLQIALKYMNG